jgi:hypothetical protein
MRRLGSVVFVITALCATGCSTPQNTKDLAQQAIEAMGGEQVQRLQSYVMRGGSGSRSRLGQHTKTGQTDPTAKLANVTETFDLAGGRAALD